MRLPFPHSFAGHFNSHAPCGARQYHHGTGGLCGDFNSHAPCGARQDDHYRLQNTHPFQLTRPLRGATVRLQTLVLMRNISTHTPLAGRDLIRSGAGRGNTISTHTPLAGRDLRHIRADSKAVISTHTPLAGRDKSNQTMSTTTSISTHTPLAGRDWKKRQKLSENT